MKSVFKAVFAVGLMACTSLAVADEGKSPLRDRCFDQVTAVTAPKLDALRSKMRSARAKDGKTYYEVYRLYRGFHLSATRFDDIKQSADAISTSSIFAVNHCSYFFGDMDKGEKETISRVERLSANAFLAEDTVPKIDAFYGQFDHFIKSYYNVYVAK